MNPVNSVAPPAPPFGDRPVWRERIGTYLLGVGIGLILVGFLLWGRYQSAQRQHAAEAAEKAAAAGSAPAAGTNNPPTDLP